MRAANDGPLRDVTRRHLFERCGVGLGALALGSLMDRKLFGATRNAPAAAGKPHYAPKARSVIYLFQAGGPSQLELFDHKPVLASYHGQPTPSQFVEGRRFAFLKPDAKLLGPQRAFGRYGQSGATLSDLLPYHRGIVDEVCFVKSMTTDVFNHGPAKLFVNTGTPQPGRPSMGSWISYGIGSDCSDLPSFVVLQSGPRGPRAGAALWASGFLPTTHQGVPFRGRGEPILNLSSPPGFDAQRQRDFYDAVGDLNRLRLDLVGDPEIATRIAAYEMAYRMQTSAPELMDISNEPPGTFDLYGQDAKQPGTYAANCLLARRLVERGVRFVQLYHTNWDHHGGPGETLNKDLPATAHAVDQASAGLVLDLKQRGLLDETLVVWGGEFGRTPMGEPRDTTGRDHHIDAFTIWLAGAGIRRGVTVGATDDLGMTVTQDRYHVHDLQATILHLLGIDHERLTFRFQGRDFRLTDVHGKLMRQALA